MIYRHRCPGPCNLCNRMIFTGSELCDSCANPKPARPLPSELMQRTARMERELAEMKSYLRDRRAAA